jgi:hypothetical protein
MTTIVGTENLTANRLIDEIRLGARFTALTGCTCAIPSKHTPTTRIQYVPPRQSPVPTGLRLTAASLLVGWWTLLHGQFDTFGSLLTNLRGGIDITEPVLRNAEHIFDRGFASPEQLRTLHSLAGEVGARRG